MQFVDRSTRCCRSRAPVYSGEMIERADAAPGTVRPLVVTGPTGWIGSALLATLAGHGDNWAARVRLFGSSERPVTAPDGTTLPMQALKTIVPADVAGADVVHLAYLTKERVELLGERAFFDRNTAIDEALLSAMEQATPHALFVASSGAAALAEEGRDRHLYGVAKLLQEDRFLRFGHNNGVPVIAARIFNIAGPFINKRHSYAISSFLTQAFETGRIVVTAQRPVYRSYLHVCDLAVLALALIDRGIGRERPVDFCGSEVVEMIDIARVAARVAGLDPHIIEREPIDFERPSAYLGDPVELRTLAARCGITLANFAAQVYDTAAFLKA